MDNRQEHHNKWDANRSSLIEYLLDLCGRVGVVKGGGGGCREQTDNQTGAKMDLGKVSICTKSSCWR